MNAAAAATAEVDTVAAAVAAAVLVAAAGDSPRPAERAWPLRGVAPLRAAAVRICLALFLVLLGAPAIGSAGSFCCWFV